jgi:hypothetical protein
MTAGRLIHYTLNFTVFFLVQVFIMKDLVLFGTAFCFLYVFFLLHLPIETKPIPLMLISFLTGVLIDFFYDTMGMHAASCVLLAFVRNTWINANTPRGGYDDNVPPTLLNMGFGWYLTYSLPLITTHHLLFFYIDNLGTELYLPLVIRVISSVFFTFVLGIIIQMIFYNKKRGI